MSTGAGTAKDLLETKAVRRGLSLKIFEWGRLEPASGGTVRQEIRLKRGLTSEQAKELAKRIRDAFPKTKPVIQGRRGFASRRSRRDELQSVIADLRAARLPRGRSSFHESTASRVSRPPSDDALRRGRPYASAVRSYAVAGRWLAAESCTAASSATSSPRSRARAIHFLGGIVSYSNAAKEELLGVPADLLERTGRGLGRGRRGR
jgi:hypothetical protein